MLAFHPLTPDRWGDLERLFGPSGAASGCWCMWWRVTSADFARESGEGLRSRFNEMVAHDERPGIIAYSDGTPIGWVSIGSRSEFGRLNRSPKLRPVDDQRVASIVCFFVARDHRRQGVQRELLEAAVEHARSTGFSAAEAYPIDTSVSERRSSDLFTGVLDLFLDAGFEEVARRGGRPIVRLSLRDRRPAD